MKKFSIFLIYVLLFSFILYYMIYFDKPTIIDKKKPEVSADTMFKRSSAIVSGLTESQRIQQANDIIYSPPDENITSVL